MLNTSNFTFDKDAKALVAESSEFQGHTWGNVCKVKSEHTGKVITFKIHYISYEEDEGACETIAWFYRPTTNLPNCKELVIFND